MKKIIVCYFASMGSLLGFILGLSTNMIPFAVIMVAAFTGCLLWFCDIARQWNAMRRRSDRASKPREVYNIDIPLDDDPEDKPAEDAPEAYVISGSGNVHTGMYPSEDYFKMLSKGGSYSDIRREA